MSSNLRGEHSRYEKLVWHGSFGGVDVRVRIVQTAEGQPFQTVLERYCRALDGVDRWIEQDSWEKPEPSHPWSYFIEGYIDLLGRPAWDPRAKISSSFPVELTIGKEW